MQKKKKIIMKGEWNKELKPEKDKLRGQKKKKTTSKSINRNKKEPVGDKQLLWLSNP